MKTRAEPTAPVEPDPERALSPFERAEEHEARLRRQEVRSRALKEDAEGLRRELGRAWGQIDRQQSAIETLEENVLQLAGRITELERPSSGDAPPSETSEKPAEPSPPLGAPKGPRLSPVARRLRLTLPGAVRRALDARRAVRLLRSSSLFDAAYYRERNPDIGEMDPVRHYVRRGAFERRDPHPLFDTSYYLRTQADVAASGVNPLAHFIRRGIEEQRDPTRLFESAFYLQVHPDVAASGIPPFDHFVRYGLTEGRIALSPASLRQLVAPYALGTGSDVARYIDEAESQHPSSGPPVAVAPLPASPVDDEQQAGRAAFEDEIRALLVRGLGAAKGDDSRDGALPILVAPHRLERDSDFRAERAAIVHTAPLGSRDFFKSLRHLFRARCVLDVDFHSAALLRELGIRAHFFPVGPLASLAPYDSNGPLPDEPLARGLPARVRDAISPTGGVWTGERPLDLVLFGRSTPHRVAFLSESVSLLKRYTCFVHLGNDVSQELLAGVSRRSRIVLHLHENPSEGRPFDWHHMAMLGLWQGALVVTERCHRVPGLEPGRHYLEADREELVGLVRWLLETEAGQRRARAVSIAGKDAVRKEYALTKVLARVSALLHRELPA